MKLIIEPDKLGGQWYLEQPQSCGTWKFDDADTKYVLQWSMQCHRDQCVDGLTHPKTGLPMKKPPRKQTHDFYVPSTLPKDVADMGNTATTLL